MDDCVRKFWYVLGKLGQCDQLFKRTQRRSKEGVLPGSPMSSSLPSPATELVQSLLKKAGEKKQGR
jgi:hypothetical protein